VLIFFNYNLSLYRRDWLMRKRTLNINLGINRAIDLSAVLSVSVYVAILLIVSLTYLPLWTLAGLAPLPLALRAFSQTPRGLLTSKDGHYLYRTTISTTVQTGLLFSLALWIDKML
jgi:1,4-dihydroxy-2-naphthoate octaprenyltransferase